MELKRLAETPLEGSFKKAKIIIELCSDTWKIIFTYVIGDSFANSAYISRVCKDWNYIYKNLETIKIEELLKDEDQKRRAMMICMADLCKRGIVTRFFVTQLYNEYSKSSEIVSEANLAFSSAKFGGIRLTASYWDVYSGFYVGALKRINWAEDIERTWFLTETEKFLVRYLRGTKEFVLQLAHPYSMNRVKIVHVSFSPVEWYERKVLGQLETYGPLGQFSEKGPFIPRDPRPEDRPYEKIDLLRGLEENDIFWSMIGRSKAEALTCLEDCAIDKSIPWLQGANKRGKKYGNVVPFTWFDKAFEEPDLKAKIVDLLRKYKKELSLY